MPQALVSFLHLDAKSGEETKSSSCVHVAERTSETVLTPMGISFNDSKLDPGNRQALTAGIKTAFERLHGSLGHLHKRRSDQVLGYGRHSRGTTGSDMFAMFNM